MTTKRMVVCSSYGGISSETNLGITECLKRGWASYSNVGCPDVALARNIALTSVVERVPDDPEYVILMVDDDMLFSYSEAELVCDLAYKDCLPVSAIYSTARGTVAATKLTKSEDSSGLTRHLTGLGFIAIPAVCLHALARSSRVTIHDSLRVTVFTWTGPRVSDDHLPCKKGVWVEYVVPDMWLSEDYRLTLRLGGAFLARVGVGHLKRVPIHPDEETLERYGQV